MKDELGRKIMKTFVGLRTKTYSYLINDDTDNEKAKCAKTYVIQKKFNLKIIKLFRSNSTRK